MGIRARTFAILVLPTASLSISIEARAETLPELPPDDAVVTALDALPAGESVRLPAFTVIGEGLDAHESFATRGPGIRDFCNKWVWAEDRQRALYAGGNHGVPHKFNDLWEYDLESNTWVMLHAPDPDVSPSHTWWGLTYDQARAQVLWMAPATPGAWDQGGYEGPPLRSYDTQSQSGWELVMTPPPHIRVSLGAALEYIPNRDVMLFHSNQWNGSGLQQYDPVAGTWTELIPQADLYFDNPDAPPAEAIVTYNSVQDVLVGFLGRSVYVYDFDDNLWTRVLQNVADDEINITDSRAGSDYDPFSDLHFVLVDGGLFAYDVASNSFDAIDVEAPPDFGMVYFDREHGVLVAYDETESHFVYRHEAAPDRPDEGGSTGTGSDGDGGSSSGDAAMTTTGHGSDESTTTSTDPAPNGEGQGTSSGQDSTSQGDEAPGCSCQATGSDRTLGSIAFVLMMVGFLRRR